MSVHTTPSPAGTDKADKPVTVADIRAAKGKRNIAVLTAYDYSAAVAVDKAGVDIILVGDSLGMVVLGLPDTLGVTLEDMISHTKAVVRGTRRALVVTDMPFMTYERGMDHALENATRLCRESGTRAVKLEGGFRVLPQVDALVGAGIPVMGHLGLTPQRAAALGGFKVQAKTAADGAKLVEEALALQEAGCFSIVLEAIPAPLAQRVTERLAIPTIGIGAGAGCDGQVLVYHDLLGLYDRFVPKFVRRYATLAAPITEAVAAYTADVRSGAFPGPEHSFGMKDEEARALDKAIDKALKARSAGTPGFSDPPGEPRFGDGE